MQAQGREGCPSTTTRAGSAKNERCVALGSCFTTKQN